MKKTAIVLLIFVITFSFVSCGNNPTDKSGTTAKQAGSAAFYNDQFFFFKGDQLVYLDLSDDDKLEEMSLCADSLCTHDNMTCPGYFPSWRSQLVAVDEDASRNNRGYPILYISCCFKNEKYEEDNQIIKFDMRTNTKEIILENNPEPLSGMWLHGDRIFYTARDQGLDLFSINIETKKQLHLPNDEKKAYYLGGADETHVYFTDHDGGIYRAPLDLSSQEKIGDSFTNGRVYVFDDKICYTDNLHIMVELDGIKFAACNLYSLPKDDLTAEPSLLISDISYVGTPALFQYGNKLAYCPSEDIEAYKTDAMPEDWTEFVYRDGTSSVCLYDSETNTSKKLFTDEIYNLGIYQGMNDRYFAYAASTWQVDLSQNERIETAWIIYDYQNNVQHFYK